MASLSNINGIFDVHSTGAIQFNGNHGTAGQILKSNGNAAPTWVAASTVIGGPYLPLTGGTLTGATATAAGISFTVGGTLTGTSATFSSDVFSDGLYVNSTTAVSGTQVAIVQDGAQNLQRWGTANSGQASYRFRIDKDMKFIANSGSGDNLIINSDTGNIEGTTATFSGNVTAATFNTLPIETARNNNANRIVRTNVHGYVDFGWINTTSGATTSTIDRIYASNDGYIRYVTPATFRIQVTDPYYAPAGTVSGVTSVATGNGITGGTITTTGTVSLTGTYTGRWNGTTGYYIKDTRASDITPADSTDYAMNLGFTNKVPGNANWQSYIQMKGWHDGYTSWQIIGPSTTTAYDNWYLRSGLGTTWNTAREIWHTGNFTPGNYLPLAGGTMTGDINMNSHAITNASQVYTNGWFRNNDSGEGLFNTATSNHFYSDGRYWNIGYSGTTGIRLRNGHAGTILGYLYAETDGQFGLLDKDGHWTFRTNGVNVTELRCNNVIGFVMNASGQVTLSSTLTTNGAIQANSSINLKNQISLPSSGLSNISGRPAYAIYQEGGAWTYPYPDLCLAMHTGIKLGAHANYNGIRFYDDYTMATQIMAVNDGSSPIGAGNVYVNNILQAGASVRAPIFYDTNTSYYGDFASTSVLNALQFNYTQHGSANNIRMGNSTTMNAISSGTNNAAFGVEALGNCSTGSRNFAYGYAALYSLSSGGSNIAMGDATGYNVTSGSNNLLFGQNAGRTGYQSPYQSIAGITTGSNQIHMGNESHTTARIQISWTVNSDSRDKTDVTPINIGLDFVKDLNPVTFRWDKRSDYEDRVPTGQNKLEELTLGFLAQEVEEVEKSYGYNVANKTNLVVDRDVEQDHYGITYEKMIPILTKAIQELEARVKELENK